MAEWKKVIVSGSDAVLNTVTASAFKGDGSALTGVAAGSLDIDNFSALGGASVAQGDNLLISDGGTEKKVTFSNFEDSIFGNVSSDITIAAGGAATIAADAVTFAKMQNISSNNVILGNDDGADSAVQELTAANVRTIINVEDGADVTDATNVTAAGALMDSEVTSLALIKGLTAAQISGSFVQASASFSTRVTANDAKLTANTSNVTSAGALMDSELASIADVSEGETYVFTAHAKVSASMEDSVCSIGLFELNSSGEVVNWSHEENGADPGGIKFSEKVGINETEWKQVQVRKTIKFGETSGLGVRFDNNRAASKIYWDDVSVYKIDTATDDITKAYRFDLFVKQYDSGIDSIRLSSQASMVINSGSNAVSHSLNAAWSGSGDLYIGGNDTTPFGSKLTGSMMEFRLWTEPLDEDKFDVHVARPKSYIGNQETSSFTTLVRRLEFDDDKVLTNSASIRDTRPDQTTTQSGSANHFGSVNTFESIVDKTKTLIPNSGPNRRMATKIRIEDNYLSGSGANLSIDNRYDFSSNDTAPLDSPRLSVMFSPVDVINEDIISSFASLDFNQYLGDPRDDFTESYRGLKNVADVYFQKYTGNNNLFDYIRLIKYYDQSVFKQLRKVIPARAKVQMGTLIEGNIFERPKSPIQKNKPSQTQPYYSDTINVSNFDTEHEDSRSVVLPKGEYLNYIGTISNEELHEPALYNFAANDNFEDRNRYINGDVTFNGPKSVFSEPTGAYIDSNRLSLHNQEYKFHYTSSNDFDKSDKISVTKDKNLYTSKSLVSTDLDPEYQFILGLNRSFYEGVKNTKNTTTDGDSPVVVRVTAPSVAVPFDAGDSNLKVLEKNKGI